MARYLTTEPIVNCKCGASFPTSAFVRVPSFPADGMWDRYCPNPKCDTFWGAAPYPSKPNIFNSCFEDG